VKQNRGFTLIELMIVIVVIAILAAIALPSYTNQVRKSRRSEVEASIEQVALFQERFRADCTTYASAFNFACPSGAPTFPGNPYGSGHYTLTVPAGGTTNYQIQAVAIGSQANDLASGVSCKTLLYDFGTTPGVVAETPPECWAK
jgi:type IV pilus assembly protein PilE